MIRIQRLIRLIQLLQQDGPCPIDTILDKLGISRRTFFRDINTLELAGVHCTFDRQEQGYTLDGSHFLPPVMLKPEEALALMLLTRKAIHRQVTPYHGYAATAGMKIEAALPDAVRKDCGELLAGVDMRYWPLSDMESIEHYLFRLQQAATECHKVAVQYDSYYEGTEITTVLHPYRLVFMRRAWYAIGLSEAHRQVRIFKVERIINLNVLDQPFEPDPAFDLDDFFGNAWQMIRGDQRYHVAIRFSPKVAGNVEEVTWHKTQQTRRNDDDSLIFEVDVDGLTEIVWWVLGYGAEAVVLEPPELRDLVTEHVTRMTAQYADGSLSTGG